MSDEYCPGCMTLPDYQLNLIRELGKFRFTKQLRLCLATHKLTEQDCAGLLDFARRHFTLPEPLKCSCGCGLEKPAVSGFDPAAEAAATVEHELSELRKRL